MDFIDYTATRQHAIFSLCAMVMFCMQLIPFDGFYFVSCTMLAKVHTTTIIKNFFTFRRHRRHSRRDAQREGASAKAADGTLVAHSAPNAASHPVERIRRFGGRNTAREARSAFYMICMIRLQYFRAGYNIFFS